MRLRARPVVALKRERKARMIDAFLRDGLGGAVAGKRILDIGCGNGDMLAWFAADNAVVGVDVRDQVRPELRHLPHVVARSEQLPFADASFDIVLSHHVIEHVDSHDGHVAEMRRVLAPDGLAYLGTPNLDSPFMRGHVGNPMVLRYPQMAPLLRRHGFRVEETYTRLLARPDHYHCETRLGGFVPAPLLHALRRWYPSQCFLLYPAGDAER